MKSFIQLALIPAVFAMSACTKPASRKSQQPSAGQSSQKNQEKAATPQSSEWNSSREVKRPARAEKVKTGSVPSENRTVQAGEAGAGSSSSSLIKPQPAVNVEIKDQPAPAAKPQTAVASQAGSVSTSGGSAQAAVARTSEKASSAATQSPAKAQNTVEIQKQEIVKISFRNLEALKELEKKSGSVLYKGQVMDQKAALQKLMDANEESFCSVKGSELFHPEDHLRIHAGDNKALDEANGIYETSLTFENSNGKLHFVCTHTTPSFFLEDMRTNFEKYLVLVDSEGKTENAKDYLNPRTEDRFLRAVQIQDLEKFKKVVVKPNSKENFALTKGEIAGLEVSVNAVRAQKELMTCFVHEVLGKLDSHKSYVQVEQGIGEDTPSEIPTAGIYHMYLADPDNGFILYCVQGKRAPLKELFSTMKGVFKFGVLERKEYRKKRAELVRIHKERTQAPAAKK